MKEILFFLARLIEISVVFSHAKNYISHTRTSLGGGGGGGGWWGGGGKAYMKNEQPHVGCSLAARQSVTSFYVKMTSPRRIAAYSIFSGSLFHVLPIKLRYLVVSKKNNQLFMGEPSLVITL